MPGTITLERILALQAAYIRCIDSNALEAWPDFFVDPCLYIVTTAENRKAGFEAGIIYADTKARPTCTRSKAIVTSSACRTS